MTWKTKSVQSTFYTFTILAFLSFYASAVFADMRLNSDQSTVSFISVKKGAVSEAHTFKKLSGVLTDSGELKLSLDLASVDTKIEIRDDRMRKHLFETEKFSTATITAQLTDLPTKPGITNISTEATLDLHGVSKRIQVEVVVFKTADELMAANTSPVIINAVDYGMEGGIAMLQKLAKLPSIAPTVPVSFVLVFTQ